MTNLSGFSLPAFIIFFPSSPLLFLKVLSILSSFSLALVLSSFLTHYFFKHLVSFFHSILLSLSSSYIIPHWKNSSHCTHLSEPVFWSPQLSLLPSLLTLSIWLSSFLSSTISFFFLFFLPLFFCLSFLSGLSPSLSFSLYPSPCYQSLSLLFSCFNEP